MGDPSLPRRRAPGPPGDGGGAAPPRPQTPAPAAPCGARRGRRSAGPSPGSSPAAWAWGAVGLYTFALAAAACGGAPPPASAVGEGDAASATDGGRAVDAGVDRDASLEADAAGHHAGPPDAAAPDAEPPDAGALRVDGGLLPPRSLVHYLTGSGADRAVRPAGPGLIVMGGGPDVDEAFAWQRDRLAGGDVVVLRTSGADGYNDYLYAEIGGVDSVHTLLVTTRALADDPWVEAEVAGAEAVFLAGGDQSTYVDAWRGTGVARALQAVWRRGGILGGTSAGAAVLGAVVFAAHQGSVASTEVLADPYDARVTLDPALLELAPLAGILTDTHFAERDRMGRLAGFLARASVDGLSSQPPTGLGLSEHAALVVEPDGTGTVLGTGAVYVVHVPGLPERCVRGQPLTYRGLRYQRLGSGDSLALPSATSAVALRTLDVEDGVMDPARPY